MIKLNNIYASYNEDIFLTSLRIFPIPIENVVHAIPKRAGALRSERSYGVRQIQASFAINGKNEKKNAELYNALLYTLTYDEPKPLVADEQPDRFYLAELVEASEIDLAAQHPECTFTFECLNPFAFSLETYTIEESQPFYYDGQIATAPLLEYTPDTSGVASKRWEVNGKHIEIKDHAFVAGRKVLVDNMNAVISEGDSSEIMAKLTLSSDWLRIVPGLNTCQLGENAKLRYRKVYL